MHLPKYTLRSGDQLLSFEFTSEGPKGLIPKRIQFTPIGYQNVYNLGFGDKDPVTGEIDDTVISNNGDSERILATVGNAAVSFLDQYPHTWIFAAGSTAARTRLYQIGINRFYEEINDRLEVYGQINDDWYPFSKNVNYQAFLVKLRNT